MQQRHMHEQEALVSHHEGEAVQRESEHLTHAQQMKQQLREKQQLRRLALDEERAARIEDERAQQLSEEKRRKNEERHDNKEAALARHVLCVSSSLRPPSSLDGHRAHKLYTWLVSLLICRLHVSRAATPLALQAP